MMDDDYLSIAPDGGINLAIQFCAEALGGTSVGGPRQQDGDCSDRTTITTARPTSCSRHSPLTVRSNGDDQR